MPYSIAKIRQGPARHKPQHDSGEAYGKAMHNDLERVEEPNEGATTRPTVVVAQPKMHGELTQDGSRGQEELIGGTTTRPPDTAAHGGAHRKLVSKDSKDYGDHF
ncbi:hypothetical protein CJ030_MR8G022410 [Morella rubra]|uniref:Uncharacterized protein n=1 Tax=Morella rubra TaxID=262757 RepID=A0A6A1URB1_9ROSI|nr:hypothetical protein CJ030_MR8G022410 [Morella rubra]